MSKMKWLTIILPALAILGVLAYFFWWKKRESVQVEENIDLFTPNIDALNTGTMEADSSGSPRRGLRNNNPGNIRISDTNWQGKIPNDENTDGSFEQFTSMVYGCRAMLKILLTYINSYGANTISLITERWAPAEDNNNPESYASTVSGETGISKSTPISADDSFFHFVK